MVKYMAVAVAVAVAVSGGGAVAVAGLTKKIFNHIQKDFLINVWVYCSYLPVRRDVRLNSRRTADGHRNLFRPEIPRRGHFGMDFSSWTFRRGRFGVDVSA